ncbi:NAD(P)-dependent oxidoreductase [Albimonas sp. CAU 1670]|uniref:NAD(P)-dependent oxidoreductase n=1 Tax=Albimonas sp. CAU 1670 TaxID=3032599 RepID=UPI0023DA9B7D|nr:NAD(P)-dependent oxidoreductase [Albimonas sp. CAU 1670]MDF2231531.1 NAD(P)-dependent oxidoreductase [Albimonas sp. CAU 1670]
MTSARRAPGIAPARLPAAELAANFSDLHPRLTDHEALVAADRCYFCHDAPCTIACPTEIDIPMFIRQIQGGHPKSAAKTIFDQNILGGMCARVCPTETLCEEACVRMTAEGDPVEIGRLQRYATDALMAENGHPFTRAPETGKRVAVVGAGPAGLSCAHRLAMHGHAVTVFEARPKPGGLNEYGIAAYKAVDGFAQAEVDWLLRIGGIEIVEGRLGAGLELDALAADFDAVFLGVGLAAVNALRAEGEDLPGVRDAVDWIAALRQAPAYDHVAVGRNVVVIGGGMTATDAAIQSAKLGAEQVTLVYRRDRAAMAASDFEVELAAAAGARVICNARPVRVTGEGEAEAIEFEYTETGPDGLAGTGETFTLPADQVMKAIGQTLVAPSGLEIEGGKIKVDAEGRSSRPGVWAGGDCASGGEDLTVTAVAQGRDAAESIHRALMT